MRTTLPAAPAGKQGWFPRVMDRTFTEKGETGSTKELASPSTAATWVDTCNSMGQGGGLSAQAAEQGR